MKKTTVILAIFATFMVSLARDMMEFDIYTELDKKINSEYTAMYAFENWGYKDISGGANWFGFYYKPLSWLTVHPFCIYGVRIPNYHDYEEIMPGFQVITINEIYEGWKFKFRSQHVIRNVKGIDDPFYRMRNLFAVVSPWKWTKYEITPSVNIVESWFTTQENWRRNKRFYHYRSAIVVSGKICEDVSMSTWFMKQWQRHGYDVGGFQGQWQFGLGVCYSF